MSRYDCPRPTERHALWICLIRTLSLVANPHTPAFQTKAPKQSNIVPKLDRQIIQQQIQTTNASNIARLMANPRVASGELERVLLEKALDDGDMAAMKLILSRTHNERTMGDTKQRDTTPVRINITTFNPDKPEEDKTVRTVINGEWQDVDDE